MPALKSQIGYKIDEMAKLVHPHDGHPKIFAMIEAYLDESGIHEGASLCVIAGYYGGIGQWRKFEKDWIKLLRQFSIPLKDFHAKDLVKRNDAKPLLSEAAKAISRYRIHPIGLGISVPDFWLFTDKQRRFFTGAVLDSGRLVTSGCPSKPYFMPFQHCVKAVVRNAPINTKASLCFGLDRPFAEYATILLRDLIANAHVQHKWTQQIGTALFPKASETPELQAADLLVHLLYLDMLERMKVHKFADKSPPPSPLRECLSRAQCIREDIAYLSKESLQDLLDQTYKEYPGWDQH